ICDLFTNGSVVQPIGDFITKILVSSANLRFVHERKRCSANWRFHHEDPSFISQLTICSRTEALFSQFAFSSRKFYFHQPTYDLFTYETFVHLIRSFITKNLVSSSYLLFVQYRKRCSANWRFHHEDPCFISLFAICSRTEALFSQLAISSRRSQFHQPICVCLRTEAVFSPFAISLRRIQDHRPIWDLLTNGTVVYHICR